MQIEKLGPYRILHRLGRGGMGTVYAATAIDTGMEAAVKVLSAPLAREEGFRDRFQAEIETLHKLKHPNIVRLFGFGEEEGVLFYAMELVDGTSLEDELRNKRTFTWREVVQITVPLCRALRHAHDRGVIHRDIKPANLLLSRQGEIKLSDFGIAKLFGASGMTADGGVIGTAEYMAPEQADGRPVNHRCDLYSLGCVMYSLCAGRPPFRARSLPEMLHMQRYAEPEPLRTFAPDVPAELEQIVADLLIKDPERRVPTALVLGRRLESMAHGLARREERQLQADQALAEDLADFSVGEPVNLDVTMAATRPELADDDFSYQLRGDHDDGLATAAGTAPGEEPLTAGRDDATVDLTAAKRGVSAPSMPRVATPTQTTMAAPLSGPVTRPPQSRFMRAEELDTEEATDSQIISPQTLVLVAALLMLGLGVWMFLKPASANRLYERVSNAAALDQMDELVARLPDIDQFLLHYPADPRAREMRDYRQEIELYRLERRFQRRARIDRGDEAMSPVERAYAEAMRYVELDASEGQARLAALIDVYGGDPALPAGGQQCLELARRQLDRLQEQADAVQGRELAELQRQLQRAEEIQAEEPHRAAQIRRGIVELYGNKPWAEEIVEQARRQQPEMARSDGTAE